MTNLIDLKAILIVALIFVPLEFLFPLRAKQKLLRKHWLNDVVYLFLNGIFISIGLLVLLEGVVALARLTIPHTVAAAVQSQPLWLQIIETLLLSDIGFYLAHRTFHAVPFLWKFHSVHHSIEEMDWLAAYRVHPLDQILTKSASYLPVFALGFSEDAILISALIYKWQSIAIHSNSAIGLGPLKWIFSSPQFHHWHHANELAAYDKNFAAQIALLDLICGTLYMPKGSPKKYGTDQPVPALFHEQMIYPFRATAVDPPTDAGQLSGDIRA